MEDKEDPAAPVTYKPVDPSTIPTGANHDWTDALVYSFTKPTNKTVRLQLLNVKNPLEYIVSGDLLKRPTDQLPTLKNMTNLTINGDHFSFTFKDKSEKEYLST